jgi:hypothetical protein
METSEKLKSVLCNPSGSVSINGSKADKAIIEHAILEIEILESEPNSYRKCPLYRDKVFYKDKVKELEEKVNNLETKTIDEGFSVGQEVWVIDDYSGGKEEVKCECCSTIKTKYKKGVKPTKIEAILDEGDGDITYYESYDRYGGDHDILYKLYRTKELAEQALKGDL